MMMKVCRAVILAAVLTVFARSAMAAKTMTFRNNTGSVIEEIYLSGSGTNDWEEDILGDEVLGQGEACQVEVRGSYAYWDLMAVANGKEAAYYEINFNDYSTITLLPGGRAEGN